MWRSRLGHLAVCLAPASLMLAFATQSAGDRETAESLLTLSVFGTLAAGLLGIFTRRVLAIVLGASAFFNNTGVRIGPGMAGATVLQ